MKELIMAVMFAVLAVASAVIVYYAICYGYRDE